MFIYLLFCFIFFSLNANAALYFMLPDELEVEDVNKNIKVKTKNRYNSADEIENQYKGKLKYKPSNSMVENDREGRYYTSASFSINKGTISKITNNDVEYDIEEKNGFKNSISAEFGYYFKNSARIGIEYFEILNNNIGFNDISVELNGKAYFLTLAIENNYSKIIPFFGIGIGAVKNDFNEEFSSLTFYNNYVEGNIVPTYQIFGGIEYSYSDNILIFTRYKYFDFIKDIELTRNYQNTTTNYLLKLESNSSISIGFKYLW